MRIALNVVGIIALLLGGLWVLQGTNMVTGSAMSGQSQWWIIGLIVVAVGLGLLYWANMRGRPRM